METCYLNTQLYIEIDGITALICFLLACSVNICYSSLISRESSTHVFR